MLAVDLDAGTSRRFAACAAPRGLALQRDALHVACADGTLDTLNATSGQRTRRLTLDNDLRDVVVAGDRLYVSRFRSAELLALDEHGAVQARLAPAPSLDPRTGDAVAAPTVAWRTLATANGEVMMLHQRSSLRVVDVHHERGYGVPAVSCASGLVSGAVTVFGVDGTSRTVAGVDSALTVDVAPNEDLTALGLASPGDVRATSDQDSARGAWSEPELTDGPSCVRSVLLSDEVDSLPSPEVVAVERDAAGNLLLQGREPAGLFDARGKLLVAFSQISVDDPAHARFHRDAGRGLACASCHPEAGDDGHVWLFAGQGLRRTQYLAGGLKGTAPFHWAGDMTSFESLMDEVHGRRMGGGDVSPEDAEALLGWIDTQPAPPLPVLDADRVERGRALFESSTTGCADCHAGALGTDNAAHDVGTGRALQTPMLRGLASRTRFMHTGCADELTDRFDADCGGRAHGQVEHLDATALGDLVEYLRSL